MNTTAVLSTLNPSRTARPARRIAAVVLLIVALTAAFAVGRTTVFTHASTVAPAHFSSFLPSADHCRPHVPC